MKDTHWVPVAPSNLPVVFNNMDLERAASTVHGSTVGWYPMSQTPRRHCRSRFRGSWELGRMAREAFNTKDLKVLGP